jgi:cadmium resistance protein CadD (predicted permease)
MNRKQLDLWLNFALGILLLIGSVYLLLTGSTVMLFGSLPLSWWFLGFIGLIFLALGIKELLELRKGDK